MFRFPIIFAIAAALLGLLGGCGAPGGGTHQLHEQDTGQTVELRAGEQLEVVLAGNPTTGYRWEQTGGDVVILRPAGEPSFTADSTLVGASGTFVFRFAGAAAGQTTLTLVYRRSFEAEIPPLKTFEAPIVVR